MKRVIIAGGRDFDDYKLLTNSIRNFMIPYTFSCGIEVISGGAKGADSLAIKFCREFNIKLTIMPADWDKYGKSAGYRRNAEMAKRAGALIAFWDGESKGTKHMIEIAKKNGLVLKICRY